ncbi:MAG: DUF1295 domain-containing protein [Promethearchaeota archaeon]
MVGFIINIHSDHIIRNLRKPGETEYKIPKGGMFRWVSCPSYLGEITEWVGWAIMTFSIPGLVFAFENFPDYPKNRKALIPFIY